MAVESKKLYAEDDISKLAVLKSTDSIAQKVKKRFANRRLHIFKWKKYPLLYFYGCINI